MPSTSCGSGSPPSTTCAAASNNRPVGIAGRRDDPLYGIRRVLRRGAEHLSTTRWARLLAGIEAGDEHGQVAAAWVAAQELRAIYRCRDRDQAAARLYDWTVTCIDSHVPELRRLARTLTTWRQL